MHRNNTESCSEFLNQRSHQMLHKDQFLIFFHSVILHVFVFLALNCRRSLSRLLLIDLSKVNTNGSALLIMESMSVCIGVVSVSAYT